MCTSRDVTWSNVVRKALTVTTCSDIAKGARNLICANTNIHIRMHARTYASTRERTLAQTHTHQFEDGLPVENITLARRYVASA